MSLETSVKASPTAEIDDPSLRASVRDGVSHAVMLGSGETYLGPFGIFLQATTLQVGLLSTLPQLFGAVMQWAGAIRMDRFPSRRRVIVTGALFQGLLWIPICILPFLFGRGETAVWLLMGLVLLYQGSNGAIVPIWNSLIGDLVDPRIRGRFFGNRNRLAGMSTFVSLLMAGLVLHLFARWDHAATGFLIIFLAAFLARLYSVHWLKGYADPEFRLSAEQVFTFRQFLRRSPHSNFAKFAFFVAAVNFGVSFSGPYFALYMLRDLHLTYLVFTAVTASAAVSQFLTFRYWGDLSDRFGNKKILNLCGWGVGVIPMLWLFSHNLGYLMVIQAYAGFVWAGFNLSAANFMFDAVTPPKRARCVAYQGLVNGVCVLFGSLCGGIAADQLPDSFAFGSWIWAPVSTLPVIFFLSGLIRFVAAGLLLKKFREVRPVEPIGHGQLIFRVSQIRPIAGASFGLFTGLFRSQRRPGREDRKSESGSGKQ
ncbi:MAG: MFS transporter [Deltaproteobacteria bacterium]|nr:MFS transporter [Deltaproteobacteria bacterium]